MQHLYTELVGLTDAQRLDARDRARKNVIRHAGDKPTRAAYDHHTASRYPGWLTVLIVGLCLVALAAAFTPSAIRLYHIGSDTFGATITDGTSAGVVGVATVLLAETGQVVFSLALAVLGTAATSRRLLYASMAISTLIALIGNVQVALPGHWGNPFAYLEAIAPPVLVLSTAYVLKGLLLETVERRHADERAYQSALTDYAELTADPEQSPRWMAAYANSLKLELQQANARGRGRDQRLELMQSLSVDDWRALVSREMQAEQWYIEAPAQDTALIASNGPFAAIPALQAISTGEDKQRHPLPAAVMVSPPSHQNGNGNGNHS